MRDVTERGGYTKMKMPKVQPVKIKLAKPFLKKFRTFTKLYHSTIIDCNSHSSTSLSNSDCSATEGL